MIRWILIGLIIYIVMEILLRIFIYFKKINSTKDKISVDRKKSESKIDRNDIIDAEFEDLDDNSKNKSK
ncbi:MAG: hypothetical protein JXA68_03390 [Ignavibacteriales bacterium]|nr:hypothetical protein [Ignavibacteriales bacterium]